MPISPWFISYYHHFLPSKAAINFSWLSIIKSLSFRRSSKELIFSSSTVLSLVPNSHFPTGAEALKINTRIQLQVLSDILVLLNSDNHTL